MSNKHWPDLMRDLAALVGPSEEGFPLVRLHGKPYRLIGDLEAGGGLSEDGAFERGECSFAHLFPDGRILRFREQIGTRADLELMSPAPRPPRES